MRVVVADPSQTLLKNLACTLESGGHDVHALTDGIETLQYIRSNHPVDALITSLQLPSMSGPELCLEVRRIASCHKPIYILVMSSGDEDPNLVEALNNGADDFIGNPPNAVELCARIGAANRMISVQRELIALAATDFLTGVLSRRAFFAKAQEFCQEAEAGGVLSAIMLDIDHFKRVNDSFGHSAGDEALRAIAHEVSKEGAVVGRLGGEEFAILLEGIPLSRAAEFAEGLRVRLGELEISIGQTKVSLTCSFGVSQWQILDTIDVLLRRADVALYKAKRSGRNRVVVGEYGVDVGDYDRSKSILRAGSRNFQRSVAA